VKLGGQASLFRALLCCAAAAAGALLLGLADDRRPLKWPVKIAAQTLLAAAVVAGGVRLTALVGDTLFMQAVTVLWIVLVTNSFNLLDNMDGLCAGTAAIAALALSLVAAASGQAALALTLSALAGACLGFLVWNLAPARIFLGDAGSQFIGFLIACLSVLVTYYHYRESPLSLALPFLILAVPLYDTVSVVAVRLKERRHPLLGDTSHFSHRLVALGLSRRQAVATIHLAALATALPALAIRELPVRTGLLLAGQAFLILGLIAMLEYAGWKRVRGPVSLTAHPELPPPSTETQDGVPPADASV
jgi:UDP-GlcNAc:undecaprenyl-phosphate GlcNAc-1-phosphate transferase